MTTTQAVAVRQGRYNAGVVHRALISRDRIIGTYCAGSRNAVHGHVMLRETSEAITCKSCVRAGA